MGRFARGLGLLAISVPWVIAAEPLLAQGGIIINGDPVVTTSTDQDTTYTAGTGLDLVGQEFSLSQVGQACAPGKALVGFNSDGSLLCTCFPGAGLTECTTGCFNLLTDPAQCGACDNPCQDVDQQCIGGFCLACNLVTQDCTAPTEACYANLTPVETICHEPSIENVPGTQGDDCMFLNGCAPFYGCVLVNDVVAPTSFVCARFCDPDDISGPNGTPRCEADAGAGFRCVRASDFYADVDADFVGFCAGPEWFP